MLEKVTYVVDFSSPFTSQNINVQELAIAYNT
jgi:phosphoserine aminotransferase